MTIAAPSNALGHHDAMLWTGTPATNLFRAAIKHSARSRPSCAAENRCSFLASVVAFPTDWRIVDIGHLLSRKRTDQMFSGQAICKGPPLTLQIGSSKHPTTRPFCFDFGAVPVGRAKWPRSRGRARSGTFPSREGDSDAGSSRPSADR